MKILVLSQDYPSNYNKYAMSYVHTRCLYYKKNRHQVVAVNFSTPEKYEYEGIEVLSLREGRDAIAMHHFDIILSHAPNIKNHARFLWRLKKTKIVFFFHGHEVLKQYKDYPSAYHWNKPNYFKLFAISSYDKLKIFFMRYWIRHLARTNKIGLIFVSEWMREQFGNKIKLKPNAHKYTVISNSVYEQFLINCYNYQLENHSADFITIRPLDGSKYCMDLVVTLATKNPQFNFHVYGKGNFFNFVQKPDNLKWINTFVSQADIPLLLNRYKAALMPTRYDSQGVMVCEMASFGIPVITTDLPVCVEMLQEFENVSFFSEKEFHEQIDMNKINQATKNNFKFDAKHLCQKEISFFNDL